MAVKKPASGPTATASQAAASQVPLEPVVLEDGPGTFEKISERLKERESGLPAVRKAVREKHDQEVVSAASCATALSRVSEIALQQAKGREA